MSGENRCPIAKPLSPIFLAFAKLPVSLTWLFQQSGSSVIFWLKWMPQGLLVKLHPQGS
jgi:hypothetical protein